MKIKRKSTNEWLKNFIRYGQYISSELFGQPIKSAEIMQNTIGKNFNVNQHLKNISNELVEHKDIISSSDSNQEYFIRRYYTDHNDCIQGEESWYIEFENKKNVFYICNWKNNKLHGICESSNKWIKYYFEGKECFDETDFKARVIKKRDCLF